MAEAGTHSRRDDELEDDGPGNSAETGLRAIWIIALVLGGILLAIGVANANAYDPSLFSSNTDSGVPQMAIGAGLLNVAVIGFLIQLGAHQVTASLRVRTPGTTARH